MSAGRHTPGPWTARGSETSVATWVVGPDGKRICTMRPSELDWNNCQAIAALPDLFLALDAMVKRFATGYNENDDECIRARAALWKAQGQQ